MVLWFIIAKLTDQDESKKTWIIRFINFLEAAFQIMDDVISVDSSDYRKEWNAYAEDIQEGKRTLIVIHAYYYGWKGDRLLQILNIKTSNEKLNQEAINCRIQYARNADFIFGMGRNRTDSILGSASRRREGQPVHISAVFGQSNHLTSFRD